MNSMLRKVIAGFSVLSVLFFIAPVHTHASFLPSFAPQMEISVRPLHPHPGDSVVLTVSDPAEDIGTTAYVWTIDDAVVDQGIGHTSISTEAGGLGITKKIQVVAVENGSARSETTTIIRPATVDIVWEGNTYTPPLYAGRPLPNGQSSVTLLALPHILTRGAEVPASTLIYSWQIDGTPIPKQSGYGKSSIVITPPRFENAFTASVTVSTQDGSTVAENSVSIQPQKPFPIFYEDAPLLGMRFDRAVEGLFPFTGDEVSFVMYPLFISNPNDILYAWSLDGAPFAVDQEKPRVATFRKVGGGTGTHTVTMSISNLNKFLEQATNSFQLTF